MNAEDIFKSRLIDFVRSMITTRCNRRRLVGCNECKKTIDLPKGMYHCAECKYDICPECSGHNQREKQKEEAKQLALGLNLPGRAAEEQKAKEEKAKEEVDIKEDELSSSPVKNEMEELEKAVEEKAVEEKPKEETVDAH